MVKWRSFWAYSAGLALVWAIVFVIVFTAKAAEAPTVLLVFAGFCIGWVSTTIARYVYPPAQRWLPPQPADLPSDG
jgi:hypothetical protein